MERHRHRSDKRPSRRLRANGDAPVYAAIDLGTNNCRLLVARSEDKTFKVIDSFSRIVRLGEGLTQTGTLAEAAIERTVEALELCARKIHRHRTCLTRSVATEACRRASNSALFFDLVESKTGLRIETIPAEEEAHLTLAGCAPLLDRETDHALVFDIGGGSTEVMWIDTGGDGLPRLRQSMSIRLGVVSLAERFGHDKITRNDYRWILDRITADLDAFDRLHDISRRVAQEKVQMLGTSGTVTTLAGIHLDLPRYDRTQIDGLRIDFDNIREIIARLLEMDYDTRCAHPCIRRERADLMIMGCAILDAICRRWPVGRLRVADRGIREGILLGLMAGGGLPHPSTAA